LKFLAVGALNTVFGYGLFALLLATNIHYSIALALSTILGVLFNFKTFGKIVFKSNNNKLLFKFILIYIIVYIINIFGIALLENNGKNPLFGAAVMLLPCAAISFTLQKKIVFNHE